MSKNRKYYAPKNALVDFNIKSIKPRTSAVRSKKISASDKLKFLKDADIYQSKNKENSN